MGTTETDEKGKWRVKIMPNGVKVRSLVEPAPGYVVPGKQDLDIMANASNVGAEVEELKAKVAALEGTVKALETGGARPIS